MEQKANKQEAQKIDAVVIFTDIRGFTEWSENTEVFQYSPEFIFDFYTGLQVCFKDWIFKSLGDGALLIKKMDVVTEKNIKQEIKAILNTIEKVNKAFDKLCNSFLNKRGQPTDLRLGWGITRGAINEMQITEQSNTADKHFDYIGANINKAARLCDLARPFGIVIDAADFTELPKLKNISFFPQTRKIKSISKPLNVWVTQEVYASFLTRENLKETPEVHVAGICYKKEKGTLQVLLAYRNSNRQLYPNLIEGCGGQLRYGESFENGVIRHFRTEMNITVKVLPSIHLFYSIQVSDQPYIPGIVFLCEYIEGTPDSKNHNKTEWVNIEELESMDEALFIPNVKNEIIQLLEMKKNAVPSIA